MDNLAREPGQVFMGMDNFGRTSSLLARVLLPGVVFGGLFSGCASRALLIPLPLLTIDSVEGPNGIAPNTLPLVLLNPADLETIVGASVTVKTRTATPLGFHRTPDVISTSLQLRVTTPR